MPTTSESPAPVSGTSQKTLQLLHKRLRRLLRVMLVLTIGLAFAAMALAIRWLTSLNGLPDIGDPFDAVRTRFDIAQRTANVALYPVSPDAPAGARAVTAGGGKLAGHDQRRQSGLRRCRE